MRGPGLHPQDCREDKKEENPSSAELYVPSSLWRVGCLLDENATSQPWLRVVRVSAGGALWTGEVVVLLAGSGPQTAVGMGSSDTCGKAGEVVHG